MALDECADCGELLDTAELHKWEDTEDDSGTFYLCGPCDGSHTGDRRLSKKPRDPEA